MGVLNVKHVYVNYVGLCSASPTKATMVCNIAHSLGINVLKLLLHKLQSFYLHSVERSPNYTPVRTYPKLTFRLQCEI